MSRIDVVMPSTPNNRYLDAAITSILSQTLTDFAFHLVLNGNIELCLSEAMRIQRVFTDDRLVVHCIPIANHGLARNWGIIHGRAKYIAVADADDICREDRLAIQYERLERSPLLAVSASSMRVFCNDEVPVLQKGLIIGDRSIRHVLRFRNCINHPTAMYPRSVLLGAGGYTGMRFAVDYDLWLKVCRLNLGEFENLDDPLVDYRIHPGQTRRTAESYVASAAALGNHALLTKSFISGAAAIRTGVLGVFASWRT